MKVEEPIRFDEHSLETPYVVVPRVGRGRPSSLAALNLERLNPRHFKIATLPGPTSDTNCVAAVDAAVEIDKLDKQYRDDLR